MAIATRIVDGPAGVKMDFGGDRHIFDFLGPAPYRLSNIEHDKPGRCQYCTARLASRYWLRAADGNEFFVGRDCIKKHAPSAAIEIYEVERAAKLASKTLGISLSEARLRELEFRRAILDRFNAAFRMVRGRVFHSFREMASQLTK